MKKIIVLVLVLSLFFGFFHAVNALFVFGGQNTRVIGCMVDDLIYADVGPPRPAKLIWAPRFTETYEYGPPRRAGQWMLGLYTFLEGECFVSTRPIIILNGNFIVMMGSSR